MELCVESLEGADGCLQFPGTRVPGDQPSLFGSTRCRVEVTWPHEVASSGFFALIGFGVGFFPAQKELP